MSYPFSKPQVTIANGASLSSVGYVGAGDLVAIEMPSSWTAAVLTFQASYDGTTFFDVVDESGAEVVVAADASQHIAIGEGGSAKAEHFHGAPYLKVRSGTSAVDVNQGGARTVSLVVRKHSLPGSL